MVGRSPDTTLAQLEHMALSKMQVGPQIAEPAEIVRPIVVSDLPILVQEKREHNWGAADRPDRMLATLRTSHHQLAQLLAGDVSDIDACMMTGRSVSSIRALRNDPAFKELLAYYVEQQEVRKFDAYERLVTLGGTAMDVLQERLEEAPDRFTNNELRQLVETTMDRSAAPSKGDPRNAQGKGAGLNVNINFVPSRPVVDAEVIEVKQIEERDQCE